MPGLQRIIPLFERMLRKSSSLFLLSSGVTLADFYFAELWHTGQSI